MARRCSPVWLPLAAAVLFGATTPGVKVLVAHSHPLALAGLLYGSAGTGLLLLGWAVGSLAGEVGPSRQDLPWLAGAILAGGVAAPILLLVGLRSGSAAAASLILSLEGVLTGVLAWWAFGESLGPRVALGMVAISGGAVVIAAAPGSTPIATWGTVAVAGACLAWAVDNNLTRKVSAGDPLRIAAIKGVAAGTVNLGLAAFTGTPWPAGVVVALAAATGVVGYGLSLALFVLSLRHLGAARTVANFSVAPFVGATLSLALPGERLTGSLAAAAGLTALGVWLHLTEDHGHEHVHAAFAHRHAHTHDLHHDHDPGPGGKTVSGRHGHWHEHSTCVHAHPHYPDLHHGHRHGEERRQGSNANGSAS